jgi:hypothetical protein
MCVREDRAVGAYDHPGAQSTLEARLWILARHRELAEKLVIAERVSRLLLLSLRAA